MNDDINVYQLSRNWFDWCFENPELISPNHSALYFFCIEHCNRLGWKEKFGLPTTMAKDAIGIRSYNTYIKTLNELVDFGFIKLIEKSKNQYSSNIIALSNNVKAHNKALDKALIKHVTKQSESTQQSIDSINKQDTSIQETNIPIYKTWREDFSIYLSELNEVYSSLITDKNYIKSKQEFYPNVDICLSLKKAVNEFWGLEKGWKHKKKSKTKIIDWKDTLTTAIGMNKVYNPYKQQGQEIQSSHPTTMPKVNYILFGEDVTHYEVAYLQNLKLYPDKVKLIKYLD
jgi:hypothetical protein